MPTNRIAKLPVADASDIETPDFQSQVKSL
jgi:hypothetical protein